MNVHWMFLYNLKVFCSDMKFKMAATAGLSLTLDPMGKMFQNASYLKPVGQLKPNSPGMIIGRSSTKFMFFMPILVGVLKCRTQFWKRTTQESFQHSLVEIGSVVSEEKIFF